MEITRDMINEVVKSKDKNSDSFKKLPFFEELMNEINRRYSNDEILALQLIFSELEREITTKTIENRLSVEYYTVIESDRFQRRNNIEIIVRKSFYLLLKDGTHKIINDKAVNRRILPFYKGNLDTLKEIYKEYDKLHDVYGFTNKNECIEAIEVLTKYKRADLDK